MAIIRSYQGIEPRIAPGVWLAENAVIIGDVVLEEGVSVWYGAVLRGDVGPIRVGRGSNVQDLSCIHTTTDRSQAIIGQDVTVGHSVVIHGAEVRDGALVGMGSILLDLAVLGERSVLGAGSLLTGGVTIPPDHLALGRPAAAKRPLTEAEALEGRRLAGEYRKLAARY